jgi:hypothetical protein
MAKWVSQWHRSGKRYRTAEAGTRQLGSAEGGAVERAERIADNAAEAVSRLAEVLHDKGLLTDAEVVQVLDLYGYEKVED